MKTIKIKYNPKLKEKFRNREIQEKWKKKYKVFDDDDLRLAISQPKFHFAEWFVARIFARKGYGVLLEKYTCKNHREKTVILKKIFNDEDMRFMIGLNLPDLFVYKSNKFFFVEVKMDNDKIFKAQEKSFGKLRKRFSCEILIYEIKEVADNFR